MSETIEQLRRRMEAAAAAEDFEEAGRLRDRISILRGQGADADPDVDTGGLVRQQPGKMGLGSSRQQVTPPEGWKPPKKPDPMTRGRGGGNRR
ncbi:UvrB/UvrC motif-containing protein [Croceicoccus marinus]|uniref:Excinuclease ABC subunit B n=1 Tax=Croceicoccus marinus TaxID=450378 RepID=A0A1Z1F9D2_9SPHN|nr:UvrB/UvrC motif-containing protein [Croceicoccus marinus]ARU15401.1 excinuclease ABC subunit B [Croceicoccus marinus]